MGATRDGEEEEGEEEIYYGRYYVGIRPDMEKHYNSATSLAKTLTTFICSVAKDKDLVTDEQAQKTQERVARMFNTIKDIQGKQRS